MDANDERTIDVASTFLQSDNGDPVSERDYAIAFLAGLILGGQSGQAFTDREIGLAVAKAVRQCKEQLRTA